MHLQKHQWASLVCMNLAILLYGSLNQEKLYALLSPPPQAVAQVPVSPIPVNVKKLSEPTLSAVAAVAIDQQSGAVLFQKNAFKIYAPASTTKLMTALVARETYSTGTILTVPDLSSVGGTKIGLKKGEQLSLESLLEGALIPSGNDAAYTIAANHPNGLDAFIALMNQKAQVLHLKSTYFENPTGFDSEVHRTTAFDLALLAREVMKDQLLRSIVGTKQTTVSDLTGKQKHVVKNTNQLLQSDSTVVGVKTGTTEEAGQVLITQFERNGHQVVLVVLGSTDRYADTTAISDWLWSTYSWLSPEEFLKMEK
jgi:D-alanyl-D-alanine carboxypeptidase (penicillin-binding protein 5/6)